MLRCAGGYRCALPCHAVLGHVTPCCAITLCRAILCRVMLCQVTLCHAKSHHPVPCHVIPFHTLPLSTIPRHTVPSCASPMDCSPTGRSRGHMGPPQPFEVVFLVPAQVNGLPLPGRVPGRTGSGGRTTGLCQTHLIPSIRTPCWLLIQSGGCRGCRQWGLRTPWSTTALSPGTVWQWTEASGTIGSSYGAGGPTRTP